MFKVDEEFHCLYSYSGNFVLLYVFSQLSKIYLVLQRLESLRECMWKKLTHKIRNSIVIDCNLIDYNALSCNAHRNYNDSIRFMKWFTVRGLTSHSGGKSSIPGRCFKSATVLHRKHGSLNQQPTGNRQNIKLVICRTRLNTRKWINIVEVDSCFISKFES